MRQHPSDHTVSSVVGLDRAPETIRSLCIFERPDYVDVFTLRTRTAAECSAEDWARAALEETPTGRSAPTLWRLLGLRLGPRPSPDYVQGWHVAARGPNWISLVATSWFMSAQAVVHVGDGQVSLALFVRHDRLAAHLIWPPVSVLHRRAVPVMLRQALAVRSSRRDAARL